MDDLKLKGVVTLIHKDSEGNVLSVEEGNNLVVTAGISEVIKLIGTGLTGDQFGYLALGSDSTAAAAGQTALVTEITTNGGARASAAVTQETTTVTGDTLQLDKTFTFTGNLTIEEVGIFNAASAGDMLGRRVTGTKTVGNGDQLQVIYKVILS